MNGIIFLYSYSLPSNINYLLLSLYSLERMFFRYVIIIYSEQMFVNTFQAKNRTYFLETFVCFLCSAMLEWIIRYLNKNIDNTFRFFGGTPMSQGKISAKQLEILEYIKSQILERGFPAFSPWHLRGCSLKIYFVRPLSSWDAGKKRLYPPGSYKATGNRDFRRVI